METLREKQSKFALMASRLIMKAFEMGYEVTFGHAYRCADCPVGHKRSLHKKRLAIDLNLFENGKYCRTHEAYQELGKWWKKLGGSWGGDFDDPSHFSLEHNGMR